MDNLRQSPLEKFQSVQMGGASRWHDLAFPDIWMLLAWFALLAIGIVAVTSASMPEAAEHGLSLYYYTNRQVAFLVVGAFASYLCFSLPMEFYQRNNRLMLIVALLLLLLVFVPHVGLEVKGSRRWLNARLFNIQVGELVKVAMILFTANWIAQNEKYFNEPQGWRALLPLFAVAGLFVVILLKQPDYGTASIVLACMFGMLFLSHLSLWRFLFLIAVAVAGMASVLMMASYRRHRLSAFLDPWHHQFDGGYQLVQSLIAFGNGGMEGLGLGQSIQKHQFLPEAHTDFIFSVISEEMGLRGSLTVMALFALLVWRALNTAHLAERVYKRFGTLVAYGIALLLAFQVMVNIAVTTGVVPTKGLTMPFISYGGSSLVIMMMAMGILLRIDAESRYLARRLGMVK